MRSAYIASTQGGGGKTTISVGLCLALRNRGVNAGYFKPVGTLAARTGDQLIDEDARFVADLLGLDDSPADICPVVLDDDALHDVLEGSEVDAMSRVEAAYARVAKGKDMLVCEGLGEIWQGRFLQTSGTDVVKRLGLATILVARFAGARLLDDICYVKDALQASMLGVIFNMVPASRLEVVRGDYTRFLDKNGIASYGVLVANSRLSAVSVGDIASGLGGTFVCGEDHRDLLAETYLIGAMSPEHALNYFRVTPNKVVIVGGDRSEIVMAALDTPTVAVVLTGNFVPGASVVARAEEAGVPLIAVDGDTVQAADGMRRLFGRLPVKEGSKIDLVAAIITQQVDLDRLVGDLSNG
jgi:BioD-like phosphotransacetylase family protein